MANLQLGDKIVFPADPNQINEIMDVVPIRFDTLQECWIVCPQDKATHMLIVVDVTTTTKYVMIEIGKCKNLYLLADAIVD